MVARLREEARGVQSARRGLDGATPRRPDHRRGRPDPDRYLRFLMLAGNRTPTQMGFAISVGIAIVAFVMALFFTPAITALIGHAAWWPGHQDSDRPDDHAPAS